jgi:hypothetical protein
LTTISAERTHKAAANFSEPWRPALLEEPKRCNVKRPAHPRNAGLDWQNMLRFVPEHT